jgi:hypothetical protein
MHNIFCDNCWHHVSRCLNEMEYKGRSDWGLVSVGMLVMFNGKWVSMSHALCVWLPFAALLALALYFGLARR